MCGINGIKDAERKKNARREDLAAMRRGERGRRESRAEYNRRMKHEAKRAKARSKGLWPNSGRPRGN